MTVGVRPQNCAFVFVLFIYAFYIVISNVVSSRPQIETSDTTSRDSQERGELRQVVISLFLFQIYAHQWLCVLCIDGVTSFPELVDLSPDLAWCLISVIQNPETTCECINQCQERYSSIYITDL